MAIQAPQDRLSFMLMPENEHFVRFRTKSVSLYQATVQTTSSADQ